MLEKLDEASDLQVWQFAKRYQYTIVTKDSDFNDLSIIKGIPPKIIWIRTGNCKITQIEQLLSNNEELIKNFIDNETEAILEIQ